MQLECGCIYMQYTYKLRRSIRILCKAICGYIYFSHARGMHTLIKIPCNQYVSTLTFHILVHANLMQSRCRCIYFSHARGTHVTYRALYKFDAIKMWVHLFPTCKRHTRYIRHSYKIHANRVYPFRSVWASLSY